MYRTDSQVHKPQIIICLLFIAYQCFVVYGSLVPLKFHYLPLSDAWTIFTSLTFIPLEKASRIDWATNIMLGIPASFLGLAIFYRTHKIRVFVPVIIAVYIICVCTSASAEFLQIFFSTRNPSLNDIIAQVLGQAVGIVLFFIFGKRLIKAVLQFTGRSPFTSKLQLLFFGYLVVIFVYNVMPLDLTLNPAAIYHEWKADHIILIPFSYPQPNLAQLTYNTVADILIWIPGALYLVRTERFSIPLTMAILGAFACCIECIQLVVVSRFTDVTDILKALVGAGLGGIIGGIGLQASTQEKRLLQKLISKHFLIEALALCLWGIVGGLVYWFPYNFTLDKTLFRQSLHNLSLIPFSHYQADSIFNAITQLFRKVLFFLPAGVIVDIMFKDRSFSPSSTFLLRASLFLLIIGIACIFELGQFFLPGRTPDLTDVLLEIIGAWTGYWLTQQLAFVPWHITKTDDLS